MPAKQTGSPMTYMLNGKQYIVIAVERRSDGARADRLRAAVAVRDGVGTSRVRRVRPWCRVPASARRVVRNSRRPTPPGYRLGVSLACSIASVALTASPALAQCRGSSASYIPMSAVVGQGGYLSSDGKGAYVDGTQGATANLHNGASLVTSVVRKEQRTLTFNLNGPVVNDPYASPLGVIQGRRRGSSGHRD